VLALYIAGKIFRNQKNVALLPPGPKGKPIIGNLLDLPAPGTQEWQHWLKHKDLYGMFATWCNRTMRTGSERCPRSKVPLAP
jgi:hypothetical protein